MNVDPSLQSLPTTFASGQSGQHHQSPIPGSPALHHTQSPFPPIYQHDAAPPPASAAAPPPAPTAPPPQPTAASAAAAPIIAQATSSPAVARPRPIVPKTPDAPFGMPSPYGFKCMTRQELQNALGATRRLDGSLFRNVCKDFGFSFDRPVGTLSTGAQEALDKGVLNTLVEREQKKGPGEDKVQWTLQMVYSFIRKLDFDSQHNHRNRCKRMAEEWDAQTSGGKRASDAPATPPQSPDTGLTPGTTARKRRRRYQDPPSVTSTPMDPSTTASFTVSTSTSSSAPTSTSLAAVPVVPGLDGENAVPGLDAQSLVRTLAEKTQHLTDSMKHIERLSAETSRLQGGLSVVTSEVAQLHVSFQSEREQAQRNQIQAQHLELVIKYKDRQIAEREEQLIQKDAMIRQLEESLRNAAGRGHECREEQLEEALKVERAAREETYDGNQQLRAIAANNAQELAALRHEVIAKDRMLQEQEAENILLRSGGNDDAVREAAAQLVTKNAEIAALKVRLNQIERQQKSQQSQPDPQLYKNAIRDLKVELCSGAFADSTTSNAASQSIDAMLTSYCSTRYDLDRDDLGPSHYGPKEGMRWAFTDYVTEQMKSLPWFVKPFCAWSDKEKDILQKELMKPIPQLWFRNMDGDWETLVEKVEGEREAFAERVMGGIGRLQDEGGLEDEDEMEDEVMQA